MLTELQVVKKNRDEKPSGFIERGGRNRSMKPEGFSSCSQEPVKSVQRVRVRFLRYNYEAIGYRCGFEACLTLEQAIKFSKTVPLT